jgi:hypothetical protein
VNLHLRLDVLVESLELVHARVSSLPADAEALFLIWLGNLEDQSDEHLLGRSTE